LDNDRAELYAMAIRERRRLSRYHCQRSRVSVPGCPLSDDAELVTWARKVADALEGQCVYDVDGMCEQLEVPDDLRDNARFLAFIDQKVFCCEQCGWFCSTDELNNDDGNELCDDCAND
jgi:hypothetical protein